MFDTTKQHVTYSTPPHKMIHGDAKEYCEELEDGPFEIVKPFESEEKSFFDPSHHLFLFQVAWIHLQQELLYLEMLPSWHRAS